MRTTPGHFAFILVVAVVFGAEGWLLGHSGGATGPAAGPAAIAGVEAGYILVSHDGRRVENLDALRAAAGDAKTREEVEIVVVRGDREVTLRLRPGQMGVYGRDVTKK